MESSGTWSPPILLYCHLQHMVFTSLSVAQGPDIKPTFQPPGRREGQRTKEQKDNASCLGESSENCHIALQLIFHWSKLSHSLQGRLAKEVSSGEQHVQLKTRSSNTEEERKEEYWDRQLAVLPQCLILDSAEQIIIWYCGVRKALELYWPEFKSNSDLLSKT